MDTLESLRSKLESAADINAVVKTMKAVAAANIGQYEASVFALADYFRTITLGLAVCLKTDKHPLSSPTGILKKPMKSARIIAIAFGSDQGLVGRFNDAMTQFVSQSLKKLPGRKDLWAVGKRIQLLLNDECFGISECFNVPGEVNAITSLIDELLIKAQQSMEQEGIDTLYLFYNRPKAGAGYTQVMQRLLPLDEEWQREFTDIKWPTNKLPQVAGDPAKTLSSIIKEYLFVSLYKAAAESLASENASRLDAMQRAEKNIDELIEDLNRNFNRLRQSSIDEELFDVVAGFEALKK